MIRTKKTNTRRNKPFGACWNRGYTIADRAKKSREFFVFDRHLSELFDLALSKAELKGKLLELRDAMRAFE